MTPEALAAWQPPPTGQRGRPRDYSDLAIETGYLLRLAFGRPWRQTEGLLRSVTGLLGIDISVPDHTTFSRRSPGLVLAASLAYAQASGPVHVVIDATSLKVYGAGERCAARHGRLRRRWLKLHLGVDATTGEIAAHVLTDGDEDDAAQVPDLVRQPEGALASPTADGADYRDPVHQAAAARQPGSPIEVVIPPRADAVLSTADPDQQSQRDRHIQLMAERGRIGWQRATGYGRRNRAEMVCLQTTSSA